MRNTHVASHAFLCLTATARRGCGRAALAARVLGRSLDKPARLRCGDWEVRTLSREQARAACKQARSRAPHLKALLPEGYAG